MRLYQTATAAFASLFLLSLPVCGASEALRKAVQLEQSGDSGAARNELRAALQQTPNDPETLSAYAVFLDRYHDPECRAAYRKSVAQMAKGAANTRLVERRLVILDLADSDRTAAAADLAIYQADGGTDLVIPAAAGPANAANFIDIPGPIRSFARMAAISPDGAPQDVLTSLARNVVTNGYQASRSNDVLEETEFLKLMTRYVSQARELDKLAGADKVIKLETCDSAQTGELLRIVGFRMRGGCGSEVVLETVNAARAFLTTDSGFPMADLEQALRTNRPFLYDYHPSHVPILYAPDYWLEAKEKGTGDFLDAFLADPSLCRFYLGMAKLDQNTADALKAGVQMSRLRAYAHVLDFFGGMFEIRDGKAIVPGGQRSAGVWADLVGASPEKGPQFFEKLLAKDDGWLASLFDSLARIHDPVQSYLTDPVRMKRLYAAVRGQLTSPGPARPVFRANADMMLLTTRLRLDADGRPHIPGGIAVWRGLFISHPHGRYDAKLSRSANAWSEPDDVVEALFALTRKTVENEPLKIFMAMSDLDHARDKPLMPATVDRLAREYRQYGGQYSILSDSPAVSDGTIGKFLDTMITLDKMHDTLGRADAAGTMQALIGLWQIFCRQGTLPIAASDKALSDILTPFEDVHGGREVFDAGRSGVKVLLSATGTAPGITAQDRMLEMLAGAATAADFDARDEIVKDMQRVLDAQRVVSLTNILQIADALDKLGAGQPAEMGAVQKIAAKISEIQLPRAPLSSQEKNALSLGYWTEKHIEGERRLNLRAEMDRAGKDPGKLHDVEASLGPILRDTLVAYNYTHYTPPGAQILYTNPLFVRGHDFIGLMGTGHTWRSTELLGTGWPSNGGGRLVGSLANLSYALAEAEQNFLVPTQTQALIWSDLVPQMILSAKIPRWWGVTPAQMHWVNLHMRLAESLLAQAALSPDLRASVVDALRPQVAPNRMFLVTRFVGNGDIHGAIEALTPLEMYIMAATLASSPTIATALKDDPVDLEIRSLVAQRPAEVSDAAISRAFGTPKPTLANSYRSELLKLRTFPTLMGYSSRIMAESWESNTLYWAALADEMHASPGQLNLLIPAWTEKVVERIFASHLEDWPALLKSLRLVGKDIRSGTPAPAAGI